MLWFRILLTIVLAVGVIRTLGEALDLSRDSDYTTGVITAATLVSLLWYGFLILGIWIWV